MIYSFSPPQVVSYCFSPSWQMEKIRHKSVKYPNQGHTASEEHNWNLNSISLSLEFILLTTIYSTTTLSLLLEDLSVSFCLPHTYSSFTYSCFSSHQNAEKSLTKKYQWIPKGIFPFSSYLISQILSVIGHSIGPEIPSVLHVMIHFWSFWFISEYGFSASFVVHSSSLHTGVIKGSILASPYFSPYAFCTE